MQQKLRRRIHKSFRQVSESSLGLSITVIVSFSLSILVFAHYAVANDSAAEVTPFGLQFKTQKSITIEKEELVLSTEKVEVTFQLRNMSRKDITTEVAFPLPEYKWSIIGRSVTNFGDFTVEVDGKKIGYKSEVKALVNGKDYTQLLKALNISIVDFENFYPMETNLVDRLKVPDKKKLVRFGVLKAPNDEEPHVVFPNWSVSVKYHWTQTFPAGKVITIKHSYGPYVGFQPYDSGSDSLREDACVDSNTSSWIEAHTSQTSGPPWALWVSYILTTANNWSGPIKDFHLVVRKKPDEEISSCFAPRLQKLDDTRIEVRVTDFIPRKDLRVYFFSRTGEVQR